MLRCIAAGKASMTAQGKARRQMTSEMTQDVERTTSRRLLLTAIGAAHLCLAAYTLHAYLLPTLYAYAPTHTVALTHAPRRVHPH